MHDRPVAPHRGWFSVTLKAYETCRRHWRREDSFRSLSGPRPSFARGRGGEKCLRNAHVTPAQIESFYLGNFAGPAFVGQNHLAPYVSTALNIYDVPATRIEAACASSGSAFFHAWSEVAAGINDVVMVVGVEKMTSQTTARTSEILAEAGDCSGEMRAGNTFASLFAMIARRHMHDFGTKKEHLASVAVKNHANGALNPDAHMRKTITLEQAMKGKPIADPLNIYDCSLISDGAAAVILAPLERAAEFTDKPVRVLGVAQASDFVALDQKQDITTFPAVRRAGERAYKMAGVGAKDIQFAELHDCFTIAEIIASEDLGFCKRGEGGPYAFEGCTLRTRSAADQYQRRTESEGPPRRRDRRRADLRPDAADPRRGRRAADRAQPDRPGRESRRLRRDVRRHHPGGGMRSGSSLYRNGDLLRAGGVHSMTRRIRRRS